ncbi:putative RNA methyltransferase [Raphanus sativus]|uniref:RNA methyltransferase n=1 Tax=Raphanus sativus TaxID=3726 RepID=A0A6J0M968_RAPSA|nr:probable RNA methyltransferase At5g51130 [Raphanus sativus]XP_056853446.1 probable RNA methyltransferase At5g51130 [Raphanus sativus]KAJ4910008.1 putative RNA methyltransferase [Raphanus sativus]
MGNDKDLKKKKKRSRSNEKSVELVVVANEAKQIQQQQQQQEKVIANEENQKPKQQQGNPNPKKKKKSQESYPFGNYKNYYGYRISNDMDEDPRLKVLNKEWFQGKDCLDIGCNSGIMTIHIANKFGCRSILGVDIDSSRVGDAQWHLRNFVRKQNHTKAGEKKSSGSKEESISLSNGEANTGSSGETKDLFQIVSFQKENFVHTRNLDDNRYDTILCLSVTKWIHLNWGDDGLITLFSKIWRLLNPGGIFIMEPQPWKSYEKNRRVSETTAMHHRTIVLRPEHFQEILLDKIGFRTVEDLTSSLSGVSKGFDRQILAFKK